MSNSLTRRTRVRRTALAGMAMAVLAVGANTPVALAQDAPAGTRPAAASAAVEDGYFAPLVDSETTWRYLADDTDPSPGEDRHAWTRPEFDDSAWASGRGGFGAKWDGTGETAEFDTGLVARTVLPMRPGGGDNIRTYFFRTTFEMTAEQLATDSEIRFEGYVDDAAQVFINGVPVKNHNVDDDTPNLAYQRGWGGELEFRIPIEHFVAGTNTIAVRLHNDRSSSSDIWFSLDHLGGELPPPPPPAEVAAPSRVILTPTARPATSQSFTWLSGHPEEATGRVQLRIGDGPIRTVRATNQGTAINQRNPHFSATVRGLQPATEYSYRVGQPGAWSPWRSFTTADPDATDFSYVYYGDAQVKLDSTWPAVVDLARRTAPHAVGSVHAGDLIDHANNDTQWENWFRGMEEAAATTNVFAAPGNHEYSGDRLMRSWKAHFEYPANQPNTSTIGELAQRTLGDDDVARQYQAYFDHWSDFAHETVYYSDYQGVRFITINATSDSTFLKPESLPSCSGAECPSNRVSALWIEYQAAWLDHILSDSPSKWNVVTFHQPVYSASAGRDEPHLRGPWVPVFQKHNIDLVQMGHDHVYARGYNNDDRTEIDGVTDGPVYIVQNSGGKHYNLETDERNVWTNNGATQVRKGEDFSSFAVVDVTRDQLRYRAYIAEHTASSTASDVPVGGVWDEFVITKHDGRKFVTEAGAPIPEFEEEPTPAPEITVQPATEVSAKAGDTVTLEVAAEGDDLTYQWQRSPLDRDAWVDIVNQDKPSLVLEDVTANTARFRYRVIVSREDVSVTSTPATVRVAVPSTTVRRAGRVRAPKVRLRAGKRAAVRVRANAAGRVRVVVRAGGKRLRRTVPVRAGAPRVVRLGRVPARARGAAVVRVVLLPADRRATTRAMTTRLAQVRR